MYRALLSALLLGLFPSFDGTSTDQVALERVLVAPPSPQLAIDEGVSASGVAIYDLATGQKLYGKRERVQGAMASLTKLMTAIIIAENHDLTEVITIPSSVADATGNKAYLPPGKRFTVGDILFALLMSSGNDAALTLAEFHSGSVSAFVQEMNQRALELGLRATAFRNPAGLDHPAQWSTPQDMAWLTMYALKNPEISARLGKAGKKITSKEGDTLQLYHTHALLHEIGPVMAGKTGTTDEAGQCLSSLVELDGKSYIVVLMHSAQRYEDMGKILASMGDTTDQVAAK